MIFTISSTLSLKINPLRDLKKVLESSGKDVQSLSHIAIVKEKARCDIFKFDDPEGGGRIAKQSLFAVETARLQKLEAKIAAHLQAEIAGQSPIYGHPLKTVTVYPKEWVSPRKRKKVEYSGAC